MTPEEEEKLLQVVALQNAQSILLARRSAEEELIRGREANAKFRTLFEQGTQFAATLAPDGTLLEANRQCVEACGFTREHVIGKPFWKGGWWRPSPQLMELVRDAIRRAAGGEAFRTETNYFIADGSERFVDLAIAPVLDRDGQVLFLSVTGMDFTERHRAEESFRQSEQKLADFFENAAIGLHWVGPDGIILRANRAELKLLGYAPDEYLGHHISEFHADPIVIDDILQRLEGALELQNYEARLRCKNGSIIHVSINSNVLWEEGQFIHTRCVTRDITEAKRADDRLKLLSEAAGILLSTDDADAMLHGLLAKIGRHLDLDCFFNYMVTEAGDVLRLASFASISSEEARHFRHLEFGQEIPGTVSLHRQPMMVAHLRQSVDPKTHALKALGLRVYFCCPLMSGNLLLGTLAYGSRTRDEFDAEERRFLETICRYVSGAYERLRLMNKLREADRRKDEFLATLAHELRNPLAPVRNAVQILHLKAPDLPELRWARDVIDRQMQSMTRLIDDLMDVSRISRNKLELRKERVELAMVVQGAVETSRPLIEQHEHKLTVTLPVMPIVLDADMTRLTQVFLNLLNNAAKYTEPGGRIDLTADREGSDIVVWVSDSGIGIASDKLPSVFELFSQVDGSSVRSQGGLGIGLSLVKRLVEMHGGSIEAASDGLGKGSKFTVRLPIVLERRPASRSLDKPGSAALESQFRILVVDDNRDAADSLAMLLEMMGNKVRMAHDGEEAVRAADEYRPHVVLCDIGLPKMNGFEVARTLRRKSWSTDLVLIAVTGWGQEDDKLKAADAGFDHHLVKPVDPPAIMKLMAELPTAVRQERAGL